MHKEALIILEHFRSPAMLGDLPAEFMDQIILEVLGVKEPIYLYIQNRESFFNIWADLVYCDGLTFRWRLSEGVAQQLSRLVKANGTLKDHAQQFLARHANSSATATPSCSCASRSYLSQRIQD